MYHTLRQGSMEELICERGYLDLEDEMKEKYAYLFEDSSMLSLMEKTFLKGAECNTQNNN